MQRRGRRPAGHDRVVRLLPRAIRNRLLEEQGLELALVCRCLDCFQDRSVCNGRDCIGLLGQRDLVFVLDHAAFLDGLFKQREVLVFELEERDVVRYLVGNSPHGAIVRGPRQRRSDLVGRQDGVDVVLGERLGR